LEHQVALADALLVPGRTQRLRLGLAALLKRFPAPASAVVARTERLVGRLLNQELPRLLSPSEFILGVDIAALLFSEYLAPELEQAELRRLQCFPELAPRLRHGPFRVQPFLAPAADIAARTLLYDEIDLRDFLRGELPLAYERVDLG